MVTAVAVNDLRASSILATPTHAPYSILPDVCWTLHSLETAILDDRTNFLSGGLGAPLASVV